MRDEVKNAVILSICVILIIVIVYLSTAIFMTGEIGNNKKEDKHTTSVISNSDKYTNRILLSNIFSQKEETYKIVIFSAKSASDELKNSILNYKGDIKLYIINMDEVMNKSVKSDNYNINISNPNDLKVKDSAILTVTNGIISKAESGNVSVIQELK